MNEKELWQLYTRLKDIHEHIIDANKYVSSWDRGKALSHLGDAARLANHTKRLIHRKIELNATPPKQGEAGGGASSHRPKLEIVK